MGKVLSIIVPTYNMERYLHKCLCSLVVSDENKQSLEVLVINDGSNDMSSSIGYEFATKYPQTFKVIDKENGNYGSCINRGIKEASGKYVKVLDADDYFETDVLDRYLVFLANTDADMILTDYHEVNEKYQATKSITFFYPSRKELKVDDYCTDDIFPTIQMHAITYKLSLIRENGYIQTEGVSYTDQEWIFIPVTYMNTFCYFPGYLYQYLMGREGQTVDIKISSKQTGIRFSLEYKRAKQYNLLQKSYNISRNKLEYLKLRQLFSWGNLYKVSILYNYFSMSQLREFDEELKQINEELYMELPNHKYGKYYGVKYIEYWRKNGRAPFRAKASSFFINTIKAIGNKNKCLLSIIRKSRIILNMR